MPAHRSDRVDPILDHLRASDDAADLDAKAVAMRLRRAAHHVDLEISRRLGPDGIELWELDVLSTLSRLGGTAPVSRLQDASQLTAGAVTHRVTKLEERGFVVRAVDTDDRRQVLVTLTAAGRRRARAVTAANDRAQRAVVAAVSPAVLARLRRDLRTFLLAVEGPDPHD